MKRWLIYPRWNNSRHWITPLLLLVMFGAMFWFGGSYALAASAQPELNQTVPPPPTPVPPTPVPSPTPRPTESNQGGQNPPRPNPTATPVQQETPPTTAPESPTTAPESPATAPATPAEGAAGTLTASVAVPALNVRQGPGTTFGIVGRLTSGVQVTVFARNADGTWLNICCLPGTQTPGWISAQFVTPGYTAEQLAALPVGSGNPITATSPITVSAAITGVVAVPSLNARAEPSTNAAILGRFTNGTEVAVLGRNSAGNWWLVCCAPNGGNAWVAAGFVRSGAPNDVRAALPVVSGLAAPASATPLPAALPTPLPSATPEAAAGTVLTIAGPSSLLAAVQGEQVVLTFSVTNDGATAAEQAEFSFELPAGLEFLSASATDGGEVIQGETTSGAPLVYVSWPELPAGVSANVRITANVAPDLANGSVLDGAAVALAGNAPSTYIPLSVGLPPVEPPDFQ